MNKTLDYNPSCRNVPLEGLASEEVILNKPQFIECGPMTALMRLADLMIQKQWRIPLELNTFQVRKKTSLPILRSDKGCK